MKAPAEEWGPRGDSLPTLAISSKGRPALGKINVFADYDGELPAISASQFDAALTTAGGGRPWVQVASLPRPRTPERFDLANPVAAGVLATVLRLTEALDFNDALWVESLAYSTLLGGSEFKRWRARTPAAFPLRRARVRRLRTRRRRCGVALARRCSAFQRLYPRDARCIGRGAGHVPHRPHPTVGHASRSRAYLLRRRRPRRVRHCARLGCRARHSHHPIAGRAAQRPGKTHQSRR